MIELPPLRPAVRALRVPRGLLLHDALAWRLYQAPAGIAPAALGGFLAANGLDERAPAPPRKPRLRQVFWVAPDQVPSRALQVRGGAAYGCVACGRSCRNMKLGPLLPADVDRLRALDWTGTGYDPAQFFVEDDEFLRRREDGACGFLRADNLCDVHARFGAAAKPLMCRMFPYIFRATPGGIAVGLRLDECFSAQRTSKGLPVIEQRADLTAMLEQHPELPLVPPTVWAGPDRMMAWEEYDAIERGLLGARDLPDAREAAPLAAAIYRAFCPMPRPPADLAELIRRADVAPRPPWTLGPEALALEDRFCRETLAGKELFLHPDLERGAALLVLETWRARREAADASPEALNIAWRSTRYGPLRDVCDGLDVGALAEAVLG